MQSLRKTSSTTRIAGFEDVTFPDLAPSKTQDHENYEGEDRKGILHYHENELIITRSDVRLDLLRYLTKRQT